MFTDPFIILCVYLHAVFHIYIISLNIRAIVRAFVAGSIATATPWQLKLHRWNVTNPYRLYLHVLLLHIY